MSKNIVFEGWLTKSPPSKRIWRTKWRRRWFALRQSGELPGQYFLDYYADRNYRRLKGTINLDLCEQVDAGLHMERTGNGSLDPRVRGSVFTIRTQSRIYHLEADSESDMERWVDAICRVCGLRATEEINEGGHYQNNVDVNNVSSQTAPAESADTTGPYIPISECRTGVRAQNSQRAFTFDPRNIVTSTRNPSERVTERCRHHHFYASQPQIRLNNPDSENDSTMSEEDAKSLTNSQQNIREYTVEKSFTKLSINPSNDELLEDGPPVPPRPPKTFAVGIEMVHRPLRIEPPDTPDPSHGLRLSRRKSQTLNAPPPTPVQVEPSTAKACNGDEDHAVDEEAFPNQASTLYSNLLLLPPVVDRNLKPRRVRCSTAPIHRATSQVPKPSTPPQYKSPDKIHYLDLDLPQKTSPVKMVDGRRVEVIHGKSNSDEECAYKTVDFLKTEAFNITRQDAEASRNSHY